LFSIIEMPFLRYLAAVFVFVVAAAAISEATLCLQGCCGLQLELPSNQLSFSNSLAKDHQAVISFHHPANQIPCCGCDASENGAANATAIVSQPSIENIQAQTNDQKVLAATASNPVQCVKWAYGPGCEDGCLVP
jgi:hypothetical protein